MISTIAPDLSQLDLGGVNAYLWTGSEGPTLIDTGMPGSVKTIITDLASIGLQPADLRRIIITHADLDHLGGARELSAQSQAIIACHTVESAYVLGQKTKKPNPGLLGYLIRPFFDLTNRRAKPGVSHVDEYLLDGQAMPEGFTVLHMPGHAPGQIALHHPDRGILIAADALNNRKGKLGLPSALFTPSMSQAIESLQRLQKLKYETACFGHGPPILSGADEKIAEFVRSVSDS
ncbi:MAG: MBL fold metallo-hydrolase [Caldilineales bacterium]|nr:MBL fold metallo-hydrolase [Caldilineales bacterium]